MTREIPGRVPALEGLIEATVALFHRLTVASENLHGQGALSAGQRGVLRGLDGLGPQTVPAMARARPVSRQHIQSVVDLLRARGLVEPRPNPASRRSPLIALTARGKRVLEAMNTREEQALARLRLAATTGQLTRAADVLGQLRVALEKRGWAGAGGRSR